MSIAAWRNVSRPFIALRTGVDVIMKHKKNGLSENG